MIADFGYGILVVTFLLSLYSVGAAVLGALNKSTAIVESARRAMLLTWPLLTLSSLALIYLLVNNHYEVEFVYQVTSRSMPTYLKITALWGGQSGSLVFWSWLMSAFASLVTLRKWDRDREFLPWVIAVASLTMAFFLAMNVLFENPFARFWQTAAGVEAYTFKPANALPFAPQDGRGLNPLLRHIGMVIHPPMLYLGFVSFVIPYAFAIAALITGRTDDRWIRLTRRWTLWAWLFLALGLVLGGRWAYDVLGWGGYWGWDPVEVAAFIPWLIGTAFLHSVMIQEKRGMFKQWNMFLIVLTYCAVIYGTFVTRSGLLSSVHAFAQSAIGPMFAVYLSLISIGSVALIIWRWGDLSSDIELKSVFSRESLFLINNFLFLTLAFICYLGMNFPLVAEIITNQRVTVGPIWYERITAPLFAALMFLMGVAPLSAWGNSTLRTLGRAIWKPAVVSLGITTVLFFTYTRNAIALTGFFLVSFVILVSLYEYWRGARARQTSQGENFFVAFWKLTARNPRRYGGYFVHISMMLMAIGILGIELFQVETQGTVQVDQSINLGGYTVKYKDIAQFPGPDGRQVTRAVVSVYQGDQYISELHPRIDYYFESQQSMTIPGQRPTLKDDLYILLVAWEPVSTAGATFKIFVNPLINWLWIGSILFSAGILIAALIPDRSRAAVREKKSVQVAQTSAAD
ncbi:MAG: heme lyase CcmF/NrfE family subunit [Anaerolineales bacterium]|nr:heme lyase CcmF/NrfE family subunit [Anaerolineales bacterium]